MEEYPHPWFFVSVASKGLSLAVSLLFATLAGRSISVAAKGLKARVDGAQCTAVSEERNGISFDCAPRFDRGRQEKLGVRKAG